jgi:hypothetical protein
VPFFFSNRLAVSPPRNPVHLAVALSLCRASRCPSGVTPTTKFTPPGDLPVSVSFTRAEEQKDCYIYCLQTSDNHACPSGGRSKVRALTRLGFVADLIPCHSPSVS